MQFVDEAKLLVKSGSGGYGIVSWRREAGVPYGGPYGGDGGKGGDVIIIGDNNVSTLFDIRNKKKISAEDGERGFTAKMSGRAGKDVYIKVPVGTTVYDAETEKIIVDILSVGQEFVICKGGKGGYGNAFFKSSFNKVPTLHENGDLGETKEILLKIRYIADVGIVGFPNAGKSTLINLISNAKPKIANYQFTTITPVLGVVKNKGKELIFADMPGLIKGASSGKGLGHEFLKHIERCYVLIHLVSLDPNDNEDVLLSIKQINDELKKYSKILLNKNIILVASKADTEWSKANIKKISAKFKNVSFISSKENDGIDKLLDKVFDECGKIITKIKRAENEQAKKSKKIEIKLKESNVDKSVDVIKVDGIFEVNSPFLTYWQHKIPLDTKDNIVRFNQKMQTVNLDEVAKKAGAKTGDTLLLNGVQFQVD